MVVGNKMKVMVMNGRALKCKDLTKEVTPYCLLQLGTTSHETRYIGSDSNPEWNEEFIFDVAPGCEVLSFSIWHKNTLKNDVVIGYAFVDFGSCKKNEKTTVNIQLMGIYSGEINLMILPMYETTASKVGRLEHEIMLLTYELSKFTGKIERLNKQVTEVTLENHKLTKANKLLEKEKKTLLEYDILSTSVSPRSSHRAFNDVFEHDIEKHPNGIFEVRNPDDEFDIITERDIDFALHTNNKERVGKDVIPGTCVIVDYKKMNGKNMTDINKFTLNDWERHLSESIEVLEDELGKLNRNDKENKRKKVSKVGDNSKMTQLLNENNELGSRVTDLESENSELKLLIKQMKIKNDEELNLFIQQIQSSEGEQKNGNIRNKINQISNEKKENDAKIEMLKEVISDLDIGINKITVETNEITQNEPNYETNINAYFENVNKYNELDIMQDYEDKIYDVIHENGDQVLQKSPDEPDVIREYFWDEYLPISTRHSNNGEENGESMLDDIHDIVDGITDDIDDFIRSNYSFQNENTLMLRSDPELYTRSDIEEENEHFKDINIRLIKENEELDGCLQLLEVQVKNLKKIQSILFDQLIKRAPTYMKQMIDKITDASQILNEDQVTLYTTHFGAVLDEMINITDGQIYTDATEREDYNFAISLLYHQLST